MTVPDLIEKLKKMVADNPKLNKAKVQVEYQGDGGCESCGYGGEELGEVSENKIYDFDNRLVISVA